jgi:hypothetical protein
VLGKGVWCGGGGGCGGGGCETSFMCLNLKQYRDLLNISTVCWPTNHDIQRQLCLQSNPYTSGFAKICVVHTYSVSTRTWPSNSNDTLQHQQLESSRLHFILLHHTRLSYLPRCHSYDPTHFFLFLKFMKCPC